MKSLKSQYECPSLRGSSEGALSIFIQIKLPSPAIPLIDDVDLGPCVFPNSCSERSLTDGESKGFNTN